MELAEQIERQWLPEADRFATSKEEREAHNHISDLRFGRFNRLSRKWDAAHLQEQSR